MTNHVDYYLLPKSSRLSLSIVIILITYRKHHCLLSERSRLNKKLLQDCFYLKFSLETQPNKIKPNQKQANKIKPNKK